MELEFWYEFASTYSYPAAMRLEDVAKEHGVAVRWQPFLLGPILHDAGFKTSPFNEQPVKGAYMWRDMHRICDALGLVFRRPEPFPQNGLAAARVATTLPDTGPRADFSRALYGLEFGEGASISDPATIEEALRRSGRDVAATLAAAGKDETKAALRAATDRARTCGIFGAPTFRCPDGEIFWGNDRMEEALKWTVRSTGKGA